MAADLATARVGCAGENVRLHSADWSAAALGDGAPKPKLCGEKNSFGLPLGLSAWSRAPLYCGTPLQSLSLSTRTIFFILGYKI